jgi:iron(III) transport system permease protein
MSFSEAVLWTLLRAVVAAGLAVPLSLWLSRFVVQAAGSSRVRRMILVVAPLFAPDLIVGYSYRSFELSLLHRPTLNHCFYFLLVLLKFLPTAAMVRLCSPPSPVSAAALHCARLTGHRPGAARFRDWTMRFHSGTLNHLPVFGIVFLLTMQEFEIASLLQIPAWTVYLFDAQAGGLDPVQTVRWLVLPVLVQLAILFPMLSCVLNNTRQQTPRWRLADTPSTPTCWPGAFVSVFAVALLWVIPLSVVSLSGFSGIIGVLRNEILIRSALLDLTAAMAISAPCAILSLLAAGKLRAMTAEFGSSMMRRPQRIMRSSLLITAVLPGLFGTLAISTVVMLAVQQPPLTELRSTVWPMAFALILFLIPRALLLTLLMPTVRDLESAHLSALLNSSADSHHRTTSARLRWWYEMRHRFLAAAILFYWSLANLTAAALLCPPTIPLLSFAGNVVPLPVRLYKFIHQGRTASLSVMALLSVVAPLLVIMLLSRLSPRIYMRITGANGNRD